MLIYLVRHGIPDYATDSLKPEGVLQAEAVGKRLAETGIDEIYSSPLGRAKQTAEPTARRLNLEIKVEDWMSESLCSRNFCGINEEGKPVTWAFWQRSKLLGKNECYDDRDSFSHGYYYRNDEAKKGAESLEKSSDEFLKKLGFLRTGEGNGYKVTEKNSKKIAIFAHQGFGLHWLAHLTKTPYHVFTATFEISHTGVTIIHFNEKTEITYPQILTVSDLSHIYTENLPRLYNGMEI
jgi:probable phosphoglycerate mutase